VGWLGIGGGGCLRESVGEVLLLLFPAEAAALQEIGMLRAWNANAIPDGANRSG